MPLVLDLDLGDVLVVGSARVTVVEKSGRKTRVAIDAPKAVKVSTERAAPAYAAAHPVSPLTNGTARG